MTDYPRKTVVIDIETAGDGKHRGFAWDAIVLTVGICVREPAPTDLPSREPTQHKNILSPCLVDMESVDGHSSTDGDWMTTVLSVNLNLNDLFVRADPLPFARAVIQRAISDAEIISFHGGSFDLPYLFRYNFLSFEDVSHRIFDTLVMAKCTIGLDTYSVEGLCDEFLHEPLSEQHYKMKKWRADLRKAPPEEVLAYVKDDARRQMDILWAIWPLAQEQYSPAFIEDEGLFVALVAKMRVNGIAIRPDTIREMVRERRAKMLGIRQELTGVGISSPNSAKDIHRYALSQGERLPMTGKNNPKTDKDVLKALPGVGAAMALLKEKDLSEEGQQELEELLSVPLTGTIVNVLQGRRTEKQISTWLLGFLSEVDNFSRIHPVWKLGSVKSDRLACEAPAAQAVPKGMFAIYGAGPGMDALEADYSQAELRLGAGYARERKMADAFAAGISIHVATTEHMYGEKYDHIQYRQAKSSNFCGFYGGGAQALTDALGVPYPLAQEIIATWRQTYPGVRVVSRQAEKAWIDRGYLVLSNGKHLWARPRYLENKLYAAFNQLIQASVAQIIKKAMVGIWRHYGDEIVLTAQIHDSLRYEIPTGHYDEVSPVICDIMVAAGPEEILTRTDPAIEMLVDPQLFFNSQAV